MSYGGERHAAALERTAKEPGFTEAWRAQFLEAAAEIRRNLE